MAQYHYGLKNKIKDKLALRDDVKDFEALITIAYLINNRLYKRCQEQKASNLVAYPRKKENIIAATQKPLKEKDKGKKKIKNLL